jgi:hypothetical protein
MGRKRADKLFCRHPSRAAPQMIGGDQPTDLSDQPCVVAGSG